MIPTKLSVVEVFTQAKQYAVPLDQRAYVWGREGRWEPFWEGRFGDAGADIPARSKAHRRRKRHNDWEALLATVLGLSSYRRWR